jgi:hypothetical protein
MKLISAFGLGAAALIASTSLAAAALDFSRDKYYAAGKHQIYLWCTGGGADSSVTVDAANGEEAIRKAVAGKANCWGVWQGLVT